MQDTTTRVSQRQWQFLGFESLSGSENMAKDAAQLAAIQNGELTEPSLRFYTWSKPTVSLGVNQNERAVERNVLVSLGYDLVRRPTGGRALLHKGDICYALAARRDWHPEFRTLRTTYRAVGAVIEQTLRSLGVDRVNAQPVPEEGSPRDPLTPCFSMLSPFEVAVNGRKICGSAQFRSGDCFLQHGSLRLFDDWTTNDLLDVWPAGEALNPSLITSLEQELGTVPEIGRIVDTFLQACTKIFGVRFAQV